jgi:hypothetical protein
LESYDGSVGYRLIDYLSTKRRQLVIANLKVRLVIGFAVGIGLSFVIQSVLDGVLSYPVPEPAATLLFLLLLLASNSTEHDGVRVKVDSTPHSNIS